MIAIASLHDKGIRWSNEEEKKETKQVKERVSCKTRGNSYVMADGSLIILFEKPHLFGKTYYHWKLHYSLNVQIIYLPSKRIVDYVVEHKGSCHDSTKFIDLKTMQMVNELFKAVGDGEMLKFCWYDSAKMLENYTYGPFKEVDLDYPDNWTFDHHVSAVPIKLKHCNGIWKEQRQSMKYLWQQIYDEHSRHIALEWCQTAIIMY